MRALRAGWDVYALLAVVERATVVLLAGLLGSGALLGGAFFLAATTNRAEFNLAIRPLAYLVVSLVIVIAVFYPSFIALHVAIGKRKKGGDLV